MHWKNLFVRVGPTWSAFASIFISAMVFAQGAHAADRHFNVGSGLWSQSTSWNPTIVPGPSDHAIVDFNSNGSSALARIDTTAIGAVSAVTVVNGATISISNQGSLLCGTDFVLGNNSEWGTLRVQTTNSSIAFPGGLNVVNDMRLGVSSGIGVVEQNAGTVNVGRAVNIGDSNAVGSMFRGLGGYFLSGTGALRAPTIRIANASSHGTLSVSGLSRVDTDRIVAGSSGTGVTGAVKQSGGQVNVSNHVLLNSDPSGTTDQAVYQMNGGRLTTPNLWIKDRCEFNFNGGTVSIGTLDMLNARVNMSDGGDKMLAFRDWHLVNSIVDVNDNAVNFQQASSVQDNVRSAIRTGYANGAWNGFSLSSTAARNNPLHNTALGYAQVSDVLEFGPNGYVFRGHNVNGNDVVAAYTYYGDTDLNGEINFDDYARIDAGFNSGTGNTWFEGDFNYDGIVNFDDYALIDLAFNTQSGVLRSSVPEPALPALAGVGLISLAKRRRRG